MRVTFAMVFDSGKVLIFFDNLHQERALYVLYTIV